MPKINQDQAAKIIENQVIDALKIKFKNSNFHPIRLIQASKSLIGLNLKTPNVELLNFNSSYLKKNKDNLIEELKETEIKPNEVITTHDIEQAFINKDRELALSMLGQLSLVSSELHILECLIEISLKQSGKSFLCIWSLYRSIFFINKQTSKLFLALSVEIILSDKFEDLIHIDSNFIHIKNIPIESICKNIIIYDNFSYEFLDLYSHLLEAYNSDLIRGLKIKDLIKNMICRKLNNIELKQFSDEHSIDYPELLNSGRFWLSKFLNKTDKQKFTIDLILFLDSIRCLFRFLDSKKHKFICFYFQKNIKDFNV